MGFAGKVVYWTIRVTYDLGVDTRVEFHLDGIEF